MAWPQIGEYTENGKTVRVFKPAFLETSSAIGSGLFPTAKHNLFRMKNGKQIISTAIFEMPVPELRF